MNWVYPNDAKFYNGGAPAVEHYNSLALARREKYPFVGEKKYANEVETLKTEGSVLFPGAISHDLIDSMLDKTNFLIKNNLNLKSHDAHYAMVNQPFLHVDEVFEVAFSDLLVDFASEFFESAPAIGTLNLRKSSLNTLPPATTQLFHCDKNCIKFFKFFIYLNDVDTPEDGPLTIVPRSIQKRPINHLIKHRWSEEEIKQIYGQDSLNYLTAKKGDLVAGITTQYHRGTKPITKERNMLTLNYVIHPELSGGRPSPPEKRFKLKSEQYESLPDSKKPVADFLGRI